MPCQVFPAHGIPTQGDLYTLVGQRPDVREYRIVDAGRNLRVVPVEQVGGLAVIVIDRCGQAVVPQPGIDADIVLGVLLPAQIRVGIGRRAVDLLPASVYVGVSQVVVFGNRGVERDVLVARDAEPGAQLEVADGFRPGHERFFRYAPGARQGGEPAPFVVFAEAGRTLAADAGVEKVAPFVGIVHPAEKCNELGFVFAPSHGCEPFFEPCAVPYVVRPECVGQEPGIRCIRPGTLGLAVRVTGHHAEIVDVVRPVVIGIGFERIGLVKVIAHLGRAVVIAQDAVSRFPAHVFARFVVLVVRRERCHDLQPRYRTERGGDVARIVEPFAAVIHLREHGHGVVGPHALVFEKFAVSAVDGSRGVVYHCRSPFPRCSAPG